MLEFIFAILGAILVYNLIMIFLGPKFKREVILTERLDKINKMNKVDLSENDSLNLPFYKRVIIPLIDKITGLIASIMPMKKNEQEKLSNDLKKAGIWLTPKEYNSRTIMVLSGSLIIGLLLGLLLNRNIREILLIGVFALLAAYVIRRFNLKSKITTRKEEIQSQLPGVLDLLSISVTAGLGFDQAIGYLTSKDKGPLIEELEISRREISLGKTRKEALLSLAERCEVEELKTFVSAVNQSDELGISLKNVLVTQSKSIRLAHKQQIEEKAMKIPVKIIFPIVIFIFPVIFIVILGPAVPQIIKTFNGL